jgi:hypothetical protein
MPLPPAAQAAVAGQGRSQRVLESRLLSMVHQLPLLPQPPQLLQEVFADQAEP